MDLREGLVLPGFVDTHVHFPQVRAIGGLGMPLLDWLEKCALPEEARLADASYAASVATDFVSGLARAGTTTALVFGSHFAGAVDALFTEATRVGLRVTSGLVLSDRILREDLFTTPERAYAEGLELAKRWHGQGRTRYAVTPRFSLSCTEPMLESAGALLAEVDDLWFTSHLNENVEEIEGVRQLFGCDYTTSYERAGLLGPRSVFAHNVHPTAARALQLARHGAAVAHCPTSNAALGSGLFQLGSHLALGVRVALGSDVGAGTGFSLFKEGLQAYFVQQLLGREGHRLSAAHLLWLATGAGAEVLGLSDIGRRLLGRQGVRRALAAPVRRLAPSTSRCGTPTRPTTRSPRRSRSPGPPTWPGPGWPASGSTPSARVASPHVADPGRRPRRDPRRAPPRGGGRRQRRPARPRRRRSSRSPTSGPRRLDGLVDVELVAFGVEQRHRVVVHALLGDGAQPGGAECDQTGGLGLDQLAPGPRATTATATAGVDVDVPPVLDRLRSGTTWNQMAGPSPCGSTIPSSPMPSSSSGTPTDRYQSSQVSKPSGGGATT